MPKFSPSDDGKTIDGKIVVFLPALRGTDGGTTNAPDSQVAGGGAAPAAADSGPAGAAPDGGPQSAGPGTALPPAAEPSIKPGLPPSASPLPRLTETQKAEAAVSQAASLAAAAKEGVPFCEECERARQELAARPA